MDVEELVKKEATRRGLRKQTIKTYNYCLKKFFRTYRKDPKSITKKDVQAYLDQLIEWNKSRSTINTNLNAIKFFYEQILNKKLTVNVRHSKVTKRLPTFLTQGEIKNLFINIENSKHLLMIKLLYSTGMRVSELVSLKVKDFQFNNNYGWVREGKGGKDRLFVIAEKLKLELQRWISNKDLEMDDWVFHGQGGCHISTSTIRTIIKKAAKSAKISKNVHPHTLRHSFATHLIENGYAVTEVQPLLGHTNISTTMTYLHMASPTLLNVKSPYDALM